MDFVNLPDDPLSKFSRSVFTINGLLLQSGELVARPLGQSSVRWLVLSRASTRPQTVSQIAREIGHSRQGVQRIANALAEEGLIVYKANPTDKRADLLELTKPGTKVLTELFRRDEQWSKRLNARLDQEQLTKLAAALNTISEALRIAVNEPDEMNEGEKS